MRKLVPAALAIAFSGPVLPSPGSATTISYVGQTGTVSAVGETTTLGRSVVTKPISSLDDVDEIASVEAGDPGNPSGIPPGYYRARAELQTALMPTLLSVAGDAEADATWDGVGDFTFSEGTSASATASVSIHFQLGAAAPALITRSKTPTRANGPAMTLDNLDLGFQLSATDEGEGVISCGALSFDECNAVAEVFYGSGAVLPAGDYVLDVDVFAYDPLNYLHCTFNCYNVGGAVTLAVVPEPATALALGLGLAGLAALGRRAARTRAGGRASIQERSAAPLDRRAGA
jgi:hypothetical protein